MDDYNVNNNYEENSNDETSKSGAGTKAKVAAAVIGGIMIGIGGVKAAGKFVGKKAKSAKKNHSRKQAGKLLDDAEQKRQEMLDALEAYEAFMEDHPELAEAEEADEEETKPEEKPAEKPRAKGSRKK